MYIIIHCYNNLNNWGLLNLLTVSLNLTQITPNTIYFANVHNVPIYMHAIAFFIFMLWSNVTSKILIDSLAWTLFVPIVKCICLYWSPCVITYIRNHWLEWYNSDVVYQLLLVLIARVDWIWVVTLQVNWWPQNNYEFTECYEVLYYIYSIRLQI